MRRQIKKPLDDTADREKLREVMLELSARKADLSDAEVERLVEEELAETRKTFWAKHRR